MYENARKALDVGRLYGLAQEWVNGDAGDDEVAAAILTKLKPHLIPDGCVAVCQNHVYKQCRNHGGGMAFEECKVKPCPLKPKEPK